MIRVSDLFEEASRSIVGRPLRSVLTALGLAMGAGLFVAASGLATTGAAQVASRFDAMRATAVDFRETTGEGHVADALVPDDAEDRINALNGVLSGGPMWRIDVGPGALRGSPIRNPVGSGGVTLPVVAATQGALDAVDPAFASGIDFGEFAYQAQARVVLLGAQAARQLGVGAAGPHAAVYIQDVPFLVVGIFDDVTRNPDLLLSVVVPDTTAVRLWGLPDDNELSVLVEVAPGAAPQVAIETPLALRPHDPGRLRAILAPDLGFLAEEIKTDIGGLVWMLAGVSLLIGVATMANTMLVAVMERTSEIGLRRAIGALPRHIAAQFLGESALLAGLGGVVGTTAGVLVVLAVALIRQWQVVLDPATVLWAPLVSVAVGLVAGAYPAMKGAGLEPVEALRR